MGSGGKIPEDQKGQLPQCSRVLLKPSYKTPRSLYCSPSDHLALSLHSNDGQLVMHRLVHAPR